MWSRHSKYSTRTPPATPPLTPDAIRDICLGHGDFGKTTVNCGLLYRHSKWGNLESTPVAILRLQLNFAEPRDYKLSSADVELSFVSIDIGAEPQTIPAVTEHAYPPKIHGPPMTRVISTNREVKPQVEALGVTAGGIGVVADDQLTQTAQWTLETTRKADKNQLYTIVSWLWTSNPLNPYKELVAKRNVAVVIEHSKCKFQMNLKIDAQLCNKSKHLFWLLQSRPKTKTIADFSGQGDADLKPIVEGLKEEIHKLNSLSIPGECITKKYIPTPKQVAPAYGDRNDPALKPESR